MDGLSATDIIAILTSLLSAIGFIYHMGYKTASRIRNPSGGFGYSDSLRDTIIPYGAIFSLAFFIPLLMVFSLKSGLFGIGLFILINIFLVFVLGFLNELIVQRLLEK